LFSNVNVFRVVAWELFVPDCVTMLTWAPERSRYSAPRGTLNAVLHRPPSSIPLVLVVCMFAFCGTRKFNAIQEKMVCFGLLPETAKLFSFV